MLHISYQRLRDFVNPSLQTAVNTLYIIKRQSGTDLSAYAVNFGWIGGGRYVEATREKGTDSDKSDCMVVFRGVTEKSFAVQFSKRGGKGAAAVAGLQIIPTK